jgi:enoyl-CoA hydratase/carnithine racemase
MQGMSMPLEEGLRLENHLFQLLSRTDDSSEGTRAFAEKRKPVWQGR